MRKALLLVIGGLLASCPMTIAGGKAKDQKAVQGTWNPQSVIADGNVQSKGGIKMVFKGKSFSIRKGDRVIIAGTFTLDPSKSPSHIDLKIEKDQNVKHIGKTAQGIYKLKDNTFKWCSTEPGAGNRPDGFTSAKGSKRLLVTFERQK